MPEMMSSHAWDEGDGALTFFQFCALGPSEMGMLLE